MNPFDPHRRRHLVGRLAPVMFGFALAFLVGQAVLVVLWIDVPNLRRSPAKVDDQAASALRQPGDGIGPSSTEPVSVEPPATETLATGHASDDGVPPAGGSRSPRAAAVARATARGLLLIWPLFLAESLFHWLTRPWNRETRRDHLFSLLFVVCPSLRMCARAPEMDERMWLPGLGWRKPDRRLRRHLERHFSVPMILIALLILPVLLVELLLNRQVDRFGSLRMFVHVGTGVIWFAFAAEFILMVSVAERKLIYIKDHWIDLAIILLPLLSFLRTLQVARVSRLFRVAKIPQITKLARAYRLRGTALRALRALIVLEVLQRLLARNPEKLIGRLEKRRRELERESRLIRRKILRLRRDRDRSG